MVIIVDGYNLLKQLYPKNKENLELQKKMLVRKLGAYKKIKQESIKEILVVFDGGSLVHALREIHAGVVVLESGYNRSADDWIIEYTERYKNQEITIVSMDRALCVSCEKNGAFSMGVFDFIHVVNAVIKDTHHSEVPNDDLDGATHKFGEANISTSLDIPQSHDNIDALMNEGALMKKPNKLEKAPKLQEKQQPSSKQDKTILKKLKKIY
jgi:predicted RNA-binding protein with PIN domain